MPPAYHLIISPEAAEDIESLHRYISQDSPLNAAKFLEHLLRSIELLQTRPHRNTVECQSKKVKDDVRSIPVKPYIVYFRVLEQQKAVRILTIRHGARRQPTRFT